jgi:rfaE bifunctional protein nucleotidyltransferase chain/domain
MEKILNTNKAIQVAKTLHEQKLNIVLVGGCFDILHIGHITFLQKAKVEGDVLFVFVENDQAIKKLKGENRPINTQKDRAEILANLSMVDYVIMLPEIDDDKTYDDLVISIKPAIIAATVGDAGRMHKERQAQKIGAKVVDVISQISNKSTTRLINILNEI